MSGSAYTLNGGELPMITKTMMGQEISKMGGSASKPQMTGELAADGQSLVLHPPVGGSGAMSALSR